jgi:hypothetical protein
MNTSLSYCFYPIMGLLLVVMKARKKCVSVCMWCVCVCVCVCVWERERERERDLSSVSKLLLLWERIWRQGKVRNWRNFYCKVKVHPQGGMWISQERVVSYRAFFVGFILNLVVYSRRLHNYIWLGWFSLQHLLETLFLPLCIKNQLW